MSLEHHALDRQPDRAAQHLERRIALAVGVVAEPAQAGHRAHQLLADQAGTGLDRHADHDRAAGRAQPRQLADDPPPLRFEAVLQHFHAGDDVPRAGLGRAEIARHREADAGQVAEALAAAGDLVGLDVGAAGRGEVLVDHRHERAVATAVIEQPSALAGGHQLPREIEAAAMTPRDETARAVDLLARVVAARDAGVPFIGGL